MSHIGNIIIQHCKSKSISIASIARQLNITRSGMYKILRHNDMNLSRLRQISQALNHNFFNDYYTHIHPGDNNPSSLQTENRQLKEKLAKLQTELSLFKEIVSNTTAPPPTQ
ncbi:MAG: hypothetical protein R2750_01875 [Bacteroidales bacterium]